MDLKIKENIRLKDLEKLGFEEHTFGLYGTGDYIPSHWYTIEILGIIIGLLVIFMFVWGLLILLGFNDKLSKKKQYTVGAILMFGAIVIAWTFAILCICL